MGKLHELIAVEPNIEKTYKKIKDETMVTFSKKPDHFMAFIRTLEMKDDGRKQEELAAKEEKEMVTTVDEKLKYFEGFASEYFDALYQKEKSNQNAMDLDIL